MRGGIGRQLRSPAIIRRMTSVSDGQGGWVEDYADLYFDVPCRRRPAGEHDQTIAEQVQGEVQHIVLFLIDQDVQRSDQIIVDGYELATELVFSPSEPRYQAAACSETQLGV